MDSKSLVEIVDNILKSTIVYELKYNSFIELLFELLRENGTKIVLVDCDTKREWTANELLNAIVILGVKLSEFGISKGDVVAFFCPNSDLHVIAYLSIWAIGAVYTGLIPKSPLRELKNVIRKSNATYLIGSECTINVCNEFIATDNTIKKFLVIDDCNNGNAASIHSLIRSKIGDKERKIFFELMSKVKPNDLCKISFSSGTTGEPKAVTENHQRYMYLQVFNPGLVTDSDTCGLFQPLPHVGGSIVLCLALANKARVVVFSDLNLDEFVVQIQQFSISVVFLVPSCIRLLNTIVSKPLESSTLKRIIIGGEFASKLICEEFIEKFVPQFFGQIYGSTEVGWPIGVPISEGVTNVTAAGIPLIGCQIKIVDPVSGEILGPNQIGEICAKGPQSSDGYLNNEAANRESFDDQLFFKSGDVGYFDNKGYLYVTDRIKEVIKYNSQQVSPNELEVILIQHEAVKEAAVIGIADQTYGQLPKAFVVLKELFKGKIMETELLKFVNTQVMDFKKLRGGLVFMNELPKISIGKVDRKALRLM